MANDNRKLHSMLMCFGVLLCSAMILLSAAVRAEAKNYWIDAAVFDVQLNEDGSAEITEDWTLTFEGGTYTRYYKDIHKKVSEVESFDHLVMDEVLVDGVVCEETIDTEARPEYHYSVGESEDDLTLAAYFRFDEGTHHIVFRYRLIDVVKNWDNETAAFCYRYLGDSFDTNVGSMTVRVHAPENCSQADWDVRFDDGMTVAESSGRDIVLTGNDRTGMVKIKLWLNLDAFDGLICVDSKNADKDPLTFWDRILRLAGVIVGALALVGIIAAVRTGKRHKRWTQEYEQDYSHFSELIHHLPGQLPLCELLCQYKAPQDTRIILSLLLDLVRRQVLVPTLREEAEASPEVPAVDFRVAYTYGLEAYEQQFLYMLSGETEPRVISDYQLNAFLLTDAEVQSERMTALAEDIRKRAADRAETLAASRGVKKDEIETEAEYLYTILEVRDTGKTYPDVYDILYMTFTDLSKVLDPAVLAEMILRYGWSIGGVKVDAVHLRDASMNTETQVVNGVEEYTRRYGLDSYLLTNPVYYTDPVYGADPGCPAGGWGESTGFEGLQLPDIDRISDYFSGVVDRMEEQFESAFSSSSDSGSSCSSCSSCSGCGGGGAD